MALKPEDLKMRARSETGLNDFGDAPLEESLNRFCEAVVEEAL